MIETQIGTATRTRTTDGRAATARRSGGARWGVRLWTLLNAQALIGGAGNPADVAVVEDDRRRLAARRQRSGICHVRRSPQPERRR
jgi:hypothetical protein